MSQYDPEIEMAVEMLAEFGATATLRPISATSYNPSTGLATDTASAEVLVSALRIPIDRVDRARRLELGRTQQVEEHRFIFAPRSVSGSVTPQPEPGWVVVFAGQEYTITDVSTISPAGDDVLHDCIVKRG